MMRGTTSRMLTAAGLLAVLCSVVLLLPPPIWAQKPSSAPPVGTGRGVSDQREQADTAKDVEKLKEEIRQLKEQLSELRSRNKAIENHLTFTPEVAVQNEDYAQARAGFHTKLLKKGPSPQPWSPVKPPAGVTQIEYPSGDLRLKAG